MISYNKLLTPSQTQHKIAIQGKSMNIQHVIDLLNQAGLYKESSVVLAMVQQNKDMLEALKEVADCGAEAWGEDRPCVRIARATIARTEAAE